MAEYSHTCLKCAKPYRDLDVEDYLCNTCLAVKQSVAEQIDAMFANRPKKEPTLTPLQQYDLASKERGFMRVKI